MRRETPAGSVVCGYQPVRELLRHRPQSVARVSVAARRGGRRRREVEELCRRHGVPVADAAADRLETLCGSARHNGFCAELHQQGGVAVGQPVDPALAVLVEDVQDPRNLGALLRVCEGAGVGAVYVRDRGSAPLTPTAVKASAGASEWVPVERVTNSARLIEEHKARGFWVYGADAAGTPPWDADLSGRVLLCFGGEQKGLRARTRAVCDVLLGLPMRGRLESLNLATAAAALLYEAVRQRSRR